MVTRTVQNNTLTYTNDANGNTTAGGGRENVWDSQNRLVQTTKNNITTTYTYGVDGLRRSMTRGVVTTYYILDGQTVVQEWKDTANIGVIDANELVTYFNGQMRYKNNDENPEERWYLFDGLGTVLGEVDEDGNVTATRRLDVYGMPLTAAGTAKSDHKFVGSLGHTTDSETGLTYMRARYYDSALGRFISEDPAGNGVNWYAYCSNNPINLVDASGCEECLIGQMCAAGIINGMASMLTTYYTSGGDLGKAAGAGAIGFLAGFFAPLSLGAAATAAGVTTFFQSILSGNDIKSSLIRGVASAGIAGLFGGMAGDDLLDIQLRTIFFMAALDAELISDVALVSNKY